ncbi:uncharacterized protein [Nicotiana sylvestris]|uniref:Uncharacterized protein LOC104226520 isoform X2 n=1 Tax=Nicotiana sylvestris TaxID=4096 RepID=A0A1U7WDV2_NICSY|nr:PREDICTED: uncharacterized protein LOC104226520 isoform X2 [Nicotiana sylvestris]
MEIRPTQGQRARNLLGLFYHHNWTKFVQQPDEFIPILVQEFYSSIDNDGNYTWVRGQQGNMVAPLPPAGNLQLEVLPPLPPINISDLQGIDGTNYTGNYIPTEELDPFQLFPTAGDFGGSSQVLDPHMFGDLGIVPESVAQETNATSVSMDPLIVSAHSFRE